MQVVRDGLHVIANLNRFFIELLRSTPSLVWVLTQLLQLDRQQSESLRDIVVKLSANPGALLLLRLNEPSVYVEQCLFRCLVVGDIGYHSDHPQHAALFVKKGTSTVLQPYRSATGKQHAVGNVTGGIF